MTPGADQPQRPPDDDDAKQSPSQPLLERYEEMDREDEQGLARAIERGLAEAERKQRLHRRPEVEQAREDEDP